VEKMKTPFLGRLSLFPETRECADGGEPIVFAKPDHDATGQYLELAHHLLERAKATLAHNTN
jgi:nitrogenase subunit NifH